MFKKLVYKIVLNDLCKCDMFIGKYDAKNGKDDFMYGISTIMEAIAYSVSEKAGDNFVDVFLKNMEESEDKVKEKK